MTDSVSDLDNAIAEAGLVPGQSPSSVMLPDTKDFFVHRAARLRQLAPGHAMEPWLAFVADLADTQQSVLDRDAQLPPARQWLVDLHAVLAAFTTDVPDTVKDVVAMLSQAEDDALLHALERIQSGYPKDDDLAAAPFLVAAEQVAWTRHAAAQDAESVTPPASAHQCPICGRAPVVGMIHEGAGAAGLRYLHCGTCGCAWHHVRATCVACGDSGTLTYQAIEGGDDGIRAESCDSCQSTLKILRLEKNPEYDAIADDLASMTLDILVAEGGYQHIGVNPFLVMAAED